MTTTTPEISTLDAETAHRLMAEAVAEKGAGYVYREKGSPRSCTYLEYSGYGENAAPTGPSCLIGHVLVKAGVPMDDIIDWEGSNAYAVVGADGLDMADPGLARALSDAQAAQDRGDTWGAALAVFERRLKGNATTALAQAILDGAES